LAGSSQGSNVSWRGSHQRRTAAPNDNSAQIGSGPASQWTERGTTDISPTAAELVQRRSLNSWPPGSIRSGLPGETCTSESAGQAKITPLSAADCSLGTFEHCTYVVSPVGGTFQQLEDSEWCD
jgi:hypothetical protein